MKHVSIISPFVNYLLAPLKEMGELPSCPICCMDDPDVTEEVMLLMLQRDGLKAIFDAIFVIESLLIQMDVALASKHLSVISLLKQFYENTLFANQVVNLPTPISLPTDHFCPNGRNTWKLQNLPCVVPTDGTK